MDQTAIIKKGRGLNPLYRSYRHKEDRTHGSKQRLGCVEVGCPGHMHTESGSQVGGPPSCPSLCGA